MQLLGNFESATEKLLQVALIGQPELDDLPNSAHLRQFKQRIGRRMTIEPLEPTQVGKYIQHRWRFAGGKDAPFSTEAINCVAQVTQGIPRLINVACDNALSDAFADGAAIVEARHIIDVSRDLQWNLPISPVPQPVSQIAATPHPPVPEPPAPPWVAEAYSLKTIERYSVDGVQPSFLARLRNRFKSPKAETA